MSLGRRFRRVCLIGQLSQPSDLIDQLAIGRHAEDREALGPGFPLRQAKRHRKPGAEIGNLAGWVRHAQIVPRPTGATAPTRPDGGRSGCRAGRRGSLDEPDPEPIDRVVMDKSWRVLPLPQPNTALSW